MPPLTPLVSGPSSDHVLCLCGEADLRCIRRSASARLLRFAAAQGPALPSCDVQQSLPVLHVWRQPASQPIATPAECLLLSWMLYCSPAVRTAFVKT